MRPRDEAVVAGDAIALDNGRQLVEQCCEFAELARYRANANVHRQRQPKRRWIDPSTIAKNDLSFFQALDPFGNAGRGHADLSGQIGNRDPPIRGERRQEFGIDLIKAAVFEPKAIHDRDLLFLGMQSRMASLQHSIAEADIAS
jgi:hypothetical protein